MNKQTQKKLREKTNLRRLIEDQSEKPKYSVFGAIISDEPEDHTFGWHSYTVRERLLYWCEYHNTDELIRAFFPYKMEKKQYKESFLKQNYSECIDFEENTLKFNGYIYFRYEADAILAKMVS